MCTAFSVVDNRSIPPKEFSLAMQYSAFCY